MRLWPFGNRSQITRTRDGLMIMIPSPSNIFGVVFLSLWLVAWAIGEVFVSRQLITGQMTINRFDIGWLVGWTVFGVVAIYAWLWMVRGKEFVRVTPERIGIRRSVWSHGVERQYEAAHISGWRLIIVPRSFWSDDDSPSAFSNNGPLAFDYGERTVRFGQGLRDEEAAEILATILTIVR